MKSHATPKGHLGQPALLWGGVRVWKVSFFEDLEHLGANFLSTLLVSWIKETRPDLEGNRFGNGELSSFNSESFNDPADICNLDAVVSCATRSVHDIA